jgi:hypothetical protein
MVWDCPPLFTIFTVITVTVTINIRAPNPIATNLSKFGNNADRPEGFLGAAAGASSRSRFSSDMANYLPQLIPL